MVGSEQGTVSRLAEMPSFAPSQHLAPVWSHLTNVVVERGEGAYLVDSAGRRYLDFTSGIGVVNTGHCHPAIVAAVREQVGRLIHGQINVVFHRPLLELAERLLQVVPRRLDQLFFASSGAEAVEAALKLARRATNRPGIVVFQGGFHGRTVAAMSLTTSKSIYRAGYQPLMPGVMVAPYPYTFRYGWDAAEATEFCLRELRHLLVSQTSPEETAGVLIEPVLGEGGYVIPPDAFLEGVQSVCRELGLLLIVDEVQTGFGRTGRFFGLEHAALDPDIVVMGKGLASGFPLSAIAAPAKLMASWPTGSHGGTYGGNAVSCAAAVATIDTIMKEGLVGRAARMGNILREQLATLAARFHEVGEIRGRGLMVATEFGRSGYEPDHVSAKSVQKACIEHGLLLLTCGPYDNVIRWIPPLIVTESQIDEAVAVFRQALEVSLRRSGA
jgi:4-aminobutyrate aminotransferase